MTKTTYADGEYLSTDAESDSYNTPQKRSNKEVQVDQTLDPKRGYCEKMSVLDAAMYDNRKDKYAKAFHSYGIEKEKELEERRR